MAVVVLGGLVTTTLLTLFVLPALYLRFAPGAAPGPPRTSCSPLGRRRAEPAREREEETA